MKFTSTRPRPRGVKSQGVRVVLGISLLLIVVAMSAVWIIGSVLR
jgi:hypothetical protein